MVVELTDELSMLARAAYKHQPGNTPIPISPCSLDSGWHRFQGSHVKHREHIEDVERPDGAIELFSPGQHARPGIYDFAAKARLVLGVRKGPLT